VALHNYHHAAGSFCPAYYWVEADDPLPWYTEPGWGWGAYLLSHLEQEPLYRQITFTQPIGDPSYASLRTSILRVFVCPSDRDTGVYMVTDMQGADVYEAATTSYTAVYGSGKAEIGEQPAAGNGVFFRNSAIRVTDIKDGSSNTWAIGERGSLFARSPWVGAIHQGTVTTTPGAPTKYVQVEEAPVQVMAGITNYLPLNDENTTLYGFYSPHREVVHFLFADGSVRPLGTQVGPFTLQALASRNGSEVINQSDF
jgi:prepilin-type processing-associated H-X9-DG protein